MKTKVLGFCDSNCKNPKPYITTLLHQNLKMMRRNLAAYIEFKGCELISLRRSVWFSETRTEVSRRTLTNKEMEGKQKEVIYQRF